MSTYAKQLYSMADVMEQNGKSHDAARIRDAGQRIELLEGVVLEWLLRNEIEAISDAK